MSPDKEMTTERIDALERWQAEMDTRFAEAFPGGDHVGHCRYHQLMIEDIDARKKLRQAIVEKTLSALIWAGLVGLGLSIWAYVKNGLK